MTQNPDFNAVSRRAASRLFVAHWFRCLGGTAVVLYSAAIAAALGTWLSGLHWINLAGALAVVLAWAAATGLWAWLRRPSPVAALAYWDQQAGRHEMFVSAMCFQTQPDGGIGERLHISRAEKQLHEDLGALRRDLPVPLAHRAWVLPLLFVVLVGFVLAPEAPAKEATVDAASRKRARQVADELAERPKLPTEDQGLTPEEEEKLKKLETELDKTAKELRKLDNATPRDVLAELERRAHEAEKLAADLDSAETDLSSKMLAELERHADTTKFAAAMQAKNLDGGSKEAEKLAEKLEDDELAQDTGRRIKNALNEALKVATENDKRGLVGKHVKKAHEELDDKKPKEAGKQFRRLSKQLKQAHQRKQTQKRLQQLANQLRNSGQKIFGRNPGQMQRLSGNQRGGLRQLNPGQMQPMGNPLQQRLAAMAQGQPLQAARLAAAMPGGQLPPGAQAFVPVPGSMIPPPGTPMVMMPGSGMPMPGSGQIPIPGSGQMPGAGMMPGQGTGAGVGAPVPGSPGMGAGQGGLMAGHGTAGYGNTPTTPMAATGTGVVNANIGEQGPTQIRRIDGTHREETERRARELAIEFIKTEEEALADEPLPLSRRQQVLRYFTALRRQLVEQRSPTESGPE